MKLFFTIVAANLISALLIFGSYRFVRDQASSERAVKNANTANNQADYYLRMTQSPTPARSPR